MRVLALSILFLNTMSGAECQGLHVVILLSLEAGFILGDQAKQRQCAYLDLIALG